MTKKITIRDVAKEAKVSAGTVDRVLHNRGNVAAEKAKAVEKAIKKLNYSPSRVAQTLALQKRDIKIGIIYPEVEKYFWNEVKRGIAEAEDELGYLGVDFIVKTTKAYNMDQELEAINDLKEQGIDGMVMIPFHPSRLNREIDQLASEDIPVVTFVSDAPKSKRLCFVGVDDLSGGRIAGRLMDLYLKGKGNIAVIGIHRNILCIQQRVAGFVEKIETESPEINILEINDVRELNGIEDREQHEEVYTIACSIIDKTPNLDGIYVTNSLTGWVGKAVEDMGKQDKIKIIGHEKSEEIFDYLKKDIVKATIAQNPRADVYLAIKYLYRYITDKALPQEEIVHTNLGILIKENMDLDKFDLLPKL